MALVAANLKTDMKSATEGLLDAATALTAMGNAIAAYLLTNTVFAFSWAGAALPSTPFTPDPIVIASGAFASMTITLTPSGATSQASALTTLQNEITVGVQAATYNITSPGFVTTPATMADIGTVSLSPSGTDRDAALLSIATSIVSWITTHMPAGTCTGTHLPYVGGTGTVTGIS